MIEKSVLPKVIEEKIERLKSVEKEPITIDAI